MPRIHKILGGSSDSPTRPFLAIPSYGGMPATFVASLWETQLALGAAKLPATLEILSEHCHVDDSRNLLVRDFLETDCTDLVFLDADIGWNGESVIRLLQADHDIVAGIYPLKQELGEYPVVTLPGALRADQYGCVEVQAVPTGFLRIRRAVLEALEGRANKFRARQDAISRRPIPIIFERTFKTGTGLLGCQRVGGDYSFCEKARAAGFQVHVVPDIDFEHVGGHAWKGNLGKFWRRANGVTKMAWDIAFRELQAGEITADNIASICEHWGNIPWAAGAGLVQAWAHAVKDHGAEILEVGAGLTTIVAAAMNPVNVVYALEHDADWAAKIRRAADELGLTNLRILDTEIRDGWYVLPEGMLRKFGLVLVDGPPRNLSNRFMFTHADLDLTGATVFFDDIDQKPMVDGLDEFVRVHRGVYRIIPHKTKTFAVCVLAGAESEEPAQAGIAA